MGSESHKAFDTVEVGTSDSFHIKVRVMTDFVDTSFKEMVCKMDEDFDDSVRIQTKPSQAVDIIR